MESLIVFIKSLHSSRTPEQLGIYHLFPSLTFVWQRATYLRLACTDMVLNDIGAFPWFFRRFWRARSEIRTQYWKEYYVKSQSGWSWKGPLEVIWVKHPCSSRDSQSCLPRTVSRWLLLNISNNRDSTISLGNLCQCSVTLIVKKCFLMFSEAVASGPATGHHWNEPGSVLFAPSPQVFVDTDKIQAFSSLTVPFFSHMLMKTN